MISQKTYGQILQIQGNNNIVNMPLLNRLSDIDNVNDALNALSEEKAKNSKDADKYNSIKYIILMISIFTAFIAVISFYKNYYYLASAAVSLFIILAFPFRYFNNKSTKPAITAYAAEILYIEILKYDLLNKIKQGRQT